MKSPKSKPRIYLDTSVISYHAARPHRDPVIRERQLATSRWWEALSGRADFHVSAYVWEEIEVGDRAAARARIEIVKSLPILASDAASYRFGMQLLRDLAIPPRSRKDAFHLAVAALNNQDYIVSWNFKHMANTRVQRDYDKACRRAGLSAPGILTPQAMLEEGWP